LQHYHMDRAALKPNPTPPLAVCLRPLLTSCDRIDASMERVSDGVIGLSYDASYQSGMLCG
ncbi:hypothetical protein, partial [Streptomyces sp. NPDC058476]|uniref:hypothetical protein n=1 Tax=Streptomyces sp. NPDC058476 TaxID=3346519 RepID=UPI00366A3FC8